MGKRPNMKLFAGLVASAAAGSSVTCNNVSTGAVEMKMMVDVADVQNPAGPGADWQNNAGKWEKTFTPTNADTTEVTGNLQVTKVVDSNGCTKTTVDGVDVCVSTGHQLTFTCNYPLVDQTISTDSDFTVSGSDTTDSAVRSLTPTCRLIMWSASSMLISRQFVTLERPLQRARVTQILDLRGHLLSGAPLRSEPATFSKINNSPAQSPWQKRQQLLLLKHADLKQWNSGQRRRGELVRETTMRFLLLL